ncbi:MAG: hypothetical protein N2170_07630 [Bacteroidia bacterium]|nr:hypothetical protein [Bacteroidia bacterium]
MLDWPRLRSVLEPWRALVNQGRIPAAFLWVGSEGTGKTVSAWAITQALLCPHGDKIMPCRQCADCIALSRLSHVDLWLFPPTGGERNLEETVSRFREALRENPFLSLADWELLLLGGRGSLSIGVEGVRRLQEALSLKKAEGGWRVVWFWHAEMLTRQAANALLKLVEEPPPHVLFFFLATRAEALPATLRSRCQVWRFPPLSAEELRKLAGVELSQAQLSMAQGSFSRLKRLLEPTQAPYIQALREWLRAILTPHSQVDIASVIESLVHAPRLSELILMGVGLIREHPQLSFPQKTIGIDTLLALADAIEAHLHPHALLWEATLYLQRQWHSPRPQLGMLFG